MAQMTFLDFFSGIGGFRKGFELCGMRCVGHCEIDKYADRSYRAIHNVKEDEWYAADITKVTPAELPRADLWAAGFPCQDISVSGRQRGINGARSGLFFTLAQMHRRPPKKPGAAHAKERAFLALGGAVLPPLLRRLSPRGSSYSPSPSSAATAVA